MSAEIPEDRVRQEHALAIAHYLACRDQYEEEARQPPDDLTPEQEQAWEAEWQPAYDRANDRMMETWDAFLAAVAERLGDPRWWKRFTEGI